MIEEHHDTLKNELSNISFLKTIKQNYLINFDEDFQKNKIDNNIGNTFNVEEAFPNIFPYFSADEYNMELLCDKRNYEITNNTEIIHREQNHNNNNNCRKEKIFKIKKIRQILGRRKLNQPQLYSCGANHTKFGEDNIVRKIKIYFTNSTMSYINQKYIEFTGIKSKKRLLGRIKPNFTIAWTKKENQAYLSKQIKNIFSEKLSTKCRRFPNNYNQKQIAKIFKNGKAHEVIDILNSSVQDMYNKYIDEKNIIPGYNLQYDLNEIEKRNGKEYAKLYESVALNLIEILNKKGRKD